MRNKKPTNNSEYIPLGDIEQDNRNENEEQNDNENNDTTALITKNYSTAVSDENYSESEKTGKKSKQENDDIILSMPSTSTHITIDTNNNDEDDLNNNNKNNNNINNSNKNNINNQIKDGNSKMHSITNFFKNKLTKNKSKIKIHSVDGVFSNLNEKPQVYSETLPTYCEITGEKEIDPLGGYVVTLSQSGEYYGELVVDGLPLGSWAGMIFSTMISMAFDFLGFIMTFFLATSHATRKGSLIGLAVTIFRYGLYINEQFDEAENPEKKDKGYDPTDDEFDYAGYKGLTDQWWFSRWFGYFLMLISIAIVVRNIYTYLKIRKAINFAQNNTEYIVEG